MTVLCGCTIQGDEPLFPPLDVPDTATTCEVPATPQAMNDIIAASCGGSGCHLDGSSAGGLALDPNLAADQLVNVPASGNPGAVRVVPGAPENSYIIHKVDGTAQPRMPLIGEPLTEAEIGVFEDWVRSIPPCDEPGNGGSDAATASDASSEDTAPPDDVAGAQEVVGADDVPANPDVPAPPDVPGPPACEPQNNEFEAGFAEVVAIFQSRCSGGGCHVGGGNAGGLMLDEAVLISETVGVPSGASTRLRIMPGDPAESYLWLKLTGEAQPRMPLTGGPLTDEQLQVIESWIEDCARADAVVGEPTGK